MSKVNIIFFHLRTVNRLRFALVFTTRPRALESNQVWNNAYPLNAHTHAYTLSRAEMWAGELYVLSLKP